MARSSFIVPRDATLNQEGLTQLGFEIESNPENGELTILLPEGWKMSTSGCRGFAFSDSEGMTYAFYIRECKAFFVRS